MKDLVGSPDIILVWPEGQVVPSAAPISGYSVRTLPGSRDSWWIDIHRKAVPVWEESDLARWLARYRSLSLPDGILVATEDATGQPVATAGSISHSKDGMFPDGGQLAWVATVPDHRGRGLAYWLSALATTRLLEDGFRRVLVSTGDDMPTAIKVYRRLGYIPCLYAADQEGRWARICEQTGLSFDPGSWPTAEEYVSDGEAAPSVPGPVILER